MHKLLSTSRDLTDALRAAMRRYQCFRWSVAWASSGFPLFDELLKKRNRISQLVVGTHFYQTHPDFLKVFIGDRRFRFVPQQPSGVFHPKIYLFENSPNDWACVIGSPNFTDAAFRSNVEVAVHFDSRSLRSTETYRILRRVIDEHWNKGERLTQNDLQSYRVFWKRKRPLLGKLDDTYCAKPGKPIVKVEVLKLGWPEFVRRVKNEQNHALDKRISVLRAARTYFQDRKRLADMGREERRRIAGLAGKEQGVDWGYFGSMKGAGWFFTVVDKNDGNLSAALDAIPSDGLVSQNDYEVFVERFKKVRPNKGDSVAIATRLLCMKRPDMFVCLDSKNRSRLCKAFGIAQSNMSYARYWREVIERVRDAVWWNAPRPSAREEEAIWLGRTAFLDALYYKP